MRQVIHGIYLGHINYSESSLIGRFYTREYGRQSFLVKGIKGKKNSSVGLLQPLNELEIISNYDPSKNLNTCYSLGASLLQNTLYQDIRKSTIALFISEILIKSIQEEESNFPLYQFILGNINALGTVDFNANFHLDFLIELSLFLGFYPRLSQHNSDTLFNLEEGIFEHESHGSPAHLNPETSLLLAAILRHGTAETTLSNKQRSALLDGLVSYYETQLGLRSNAFKSHEILKTVFS